MSPLEAPPDPPVDPAPEAPAGAEAEAEAPARLLPEARHWAAIHTNARSEKVVASFLEVRKVPLFLPMRLSKRTYGARIRESHVPLFPGYLFYDHAAVDRRVVYATHRVAKILVPKNPFELAVDLEQIARAIAAEPELRNCPDIPPGTPVEVTAGPLLGIRGVMLRRGREAKLVIQVHFTGFAAEMSIDETLLQPVESVERP